MQTSSNGSELRVVVPIVAGVGNALMAVPMIRQLKEKLPSARITVLARIDAMAEPFRRMSQVSQVLVTGTGPMGLFRKWHWTRRLRADVYLVPFPSNRWQYNLLAAMSGAKRKIMHSFPVGGWRAMSFVAAERVPAVRGIHDVQQNLRLLGALGIEPNLDEAPQFNISAQDRSRVASRLDAINIGPQTSFIALHAGSAMTQLGKAKRWPASRYAQLIAKLDRELSHQFVLLEGPDEAGVGNEILAACAEQAPRMSRDLAILRLNGPLGDAAAVLERAALYVGSDSGLAHLSSAVGTRTLTIFAPADPDRVCPYGYRDLVVRPNKDCSPCFQYPWKTAYPKMLCREPMCVADVPVEAVLSAVRRALCALPVLVASPSGSA